MNKTIRKLTICAVVAALLIGVHRINYQQEQIDALKYTISDILLLTEGHHALQQPDFEKLCRYTVIIESDYGFGSGAVISKDGLILTAGHVIDAIPTKVVFIDGAEYDIISFWRDSKYDVGFVKIDAKFIDYLRLAGFIPSVGDSVYLCSSPYERELASTITKGIISFIGRDFFDWEDAIQADAEGAPGSSGGPLVDKAGNIIGICVAGKADGGGVTVCESLEHIEKALESYRNETLQAKEKVRS